MTVSLLPGDKITHAQAGLLAFSCSAPSRFVIPKQWIAHAERNKEIHSSGFCPGFSPGSLFILPSVRTQGHLYGAKISVFNRLAKKNTRFIFPLYHKLLSLNHKKQLVSVINICLTETSCRMSDRPLRSYYFLSL